MSAEIKRKMVEYLAGSGIPNEALESEETELLHSGIIDSVGVLELIMYIEETFAIHLTEEDMKEENLNSIGNIVRAIERKRKDLELSRSHEAS